MTKYLFIAGILSILTACQQTKNSAQPGTESLDQGTTGAPYKVSCSVDRPASQKLGCYPIEANLRCQLRDTKGGTVTLTEQEFEDRLLLPEELKQDSGLINGSYVIHFKADGTKDSRERLVQSMQIDLSKSGKESYERLDSLLGEDRAELLSVLCVDGVDELNSPAANPVEPENPAGAAPSEGDSGESKVASELTMSMAGTYRACEAKGRGSVRTEVLFATRGLQATIDELTIPNSTDCTGTPSESPSQIQGELKKPMGLGGGRFQFTLVGVRYEGLTQSITYAMKKDSITKDLIIEELTAFVPNARDPSKNDRESTIEIGLKLKQIRAPGM